MNTILFLFIMHYCPLGYIITEDYTCVSPSFYEELPQTTSTTR
jgi:hypothetical protein